ncbi:uncharacterized protein LOC130743683 [Lotus japonicus]|uniref:uncharacterized protein LOC130743683 n=1 Tax=Lotus japonicus TaxID=34305 RepID=UPI00258B959A|nr:uncharacterized protein LOC130743683 [Lotus japonicus]
MVPTRVGNFHFGSPVDQGHFRLCIRDILDFSPSPSSPSHSPLLSLQPSPAAQAPSAAVALPRRKRQEEWVEVKSCRFGVNRRGECQIWSDGGCTAPIRLSTARSSGGEIWVWVAGSLLHLLHRLCFSLSESGAWLRKEGCDGDGFESRLELLWFLWQGPISREGEATEKMKTVVVLVRDLEDKIKDLFC